jgi:hypothetical protein
MGCSCWRQVQGGTMEKGSMIGLVVVVIGVFVGAIL